MSYRGSFGRVLAYLFFVGMVAASAAQADQRATLPATPRCGNRVANIAGLEYGNLGILERKVIHTAVDLYVTRGILLSSLNATHFGQPYNRIVGRGTYRIGEIDEANTLFETPYDYWIAFDQEIQGRIRELRAGTRTAKQKDELAILESFYLLNLRFQPERATGTYPRRFRSYLAQRRNELLPLLITKAVDHLELTGGLVHKRNCRQILGIRWEQLMGFDMYNRSQTSVGHDRAYGARSIDFWLAFGHEVERRRTAGNRSPHLRDYSFFQITTRYRHDDKIPRVVERMYYFYRPVEQRQIVRVALQIYIKYGAYLTSVTAKDYGLFWDKIVGTHRYDRDEGEQGYMRYFSSKEEFLAAFEAERMNLIANWPAAGIMDGKSKLSPEKQLARLQGFNVLDHKGFGKMHEHPLIAPIYARHRAEARETWIVEAVDALQFHGTQVDEANCGSVLGFSWEKLTGTQGYTTRLRHQRIFDDMRDYLIAFAREAARRLNGEAELTDLERRRLQRFDLAEEFRVRRFGKAPAI